MNGDRHERERVRANGVAVRASHVTAMLAALGIDAPETQRGQAKCRREIAAGRAATATARGLLQGRDVRLARLGRSYNRTVARVTLGGRDVAGALVRLGAARWWPRGARKPDWCRSQPADMNGFDADTAITGAPRRPSHRPAGKP